MPKRKLLIALTVAGLLVAAFGTSTMSASADQHTCLVTLVGGQQITVTAPACTVDQVASQVPGAIQSIEDVTPPSTTPAPQPPVTVDAQPAPSGSTTPSATTPSNTTPSNTTPSNNDSSTTPTQEPQASGQTPQQTTGKAAKKSRDKLQGAKDTTSRAEKQAKDKADKAGSQADALTNPDGSPADGNPSLSLALPGPAPIGVPNFFIDKFRIPPFLLPIYQAAGIEYGVRWEILAGINEIETDYGRNLNVSTAGAVGWMQFMPSTWKQYGVDANHDGRKDPFNPVDAIFAAARYLKAAGADKDPRRAIFAYNHAGWYVDSVLMRARLIGGLPADLVGSLSGLTQGHFPVHARARYADAVDPKKTRRMKKSGNVAVPVTSSANRKGINIFAKAGSPAIATQDGRIVKMGNNKRLGKFIMVRDVYGNTYTYARLKKLSAYYPVPKEKSVSRAEVSKELKLPKADPKPTQPASAGKQTAPKAKAAAAKTKAAPKVSGATASPTVRKERIFANPARTAAYKAGGEEQLLNAGSSIPGYTTYKSYFSEVFGLKKSDVRLKKLKVGSKVIAGTILGRLGKTQTGTAPHMLFEIRPAGKDAPRIDPKPILDGWKLLESTAIYRAAGKNPFWGPNAKDPSIGQILLMSKEALQRRVLTDSRIKLYDCGRRDVRAGVIDRRVLATLEFLTASGLKPTVSALECGHSLMTASGNISEHSSGNAVDIAAINGIPIVGHQGAGSITDITIRRLLTLQGTMKPHQIISLMTFDGADNTLSLPDHYDHIHVGFQPLDGSDSKAGRKLNSVLKPKQWLKLIDRLGKIDNPTVFTTPSKYSIKVKPPATGSLAHPGD